MDALDVVLATGRERSVEPSIGVRPASRVKGESSGEFWVFLVDDDHAVLESLTRLLRTTGYRIKAYSSSENVSRRARHLRAGVRRAGYGHAGLERTGRPAR